MTDTQVIELGREALMLAAKLAGPFLMLSLSIGLLVGLVQAVTQLQEPNLVFVLKAVACAATLALGGGWMLGEAVQFVQHLSHLAPTLLEGG